MFPTRIWEFAVGILAFIAAQRPIRLQPRVSDLIALLCVLVILAAAVFFSESSRLPGVQSAAACVATAVALITFSRVNAPMRLFRFSGILYLGRISYGLYLWHWPPIALLYLTRNRLPDAVQGVALLAGAIAAASLSYHFVERPIRERRVSETAKQLFASLASGAAAVTAAAAVFIATDGLLQRYPAEIRPLFAASHQRGQYRCDRLYVLMNPRSEACPLFQSSEPGGVLVLGDSHADVLKELLADIGAAHHMSVYLTTRNCKMGTYHGSGYCGAEVLETVIGQAKSRGMTHVLAIAHGEPGMVKIADLSVDVQRIAAAGLKIHLLPTVPSDLSYDPRQRARRALAGEPLNLDGISRDQYLRYTRQERAAFAQMQKEFPANVSLLEPAAFLCASEQCRWQKDGVPFYLDSNHAARQRVREP